MSGIDLGAGSAAAKQDGARSIATKAVRWCPNGSAFTPWRGETAMPAEAHDLASKQLVPHSRTAAGPTSSKRSRQLFAISLWPGPLPPIDPLHALPDPGCPDPLANPAVTGGYRNGA